MKRIIVLILLIPIAINLGEPLPHAVNSESRLEYTPSFFGAKNFVGGTMENKASSGGILRVESVSSFTGWEDPYYYLAAYWAPIIIQDVSSSDDYGYSRDYITKINYDGDWVASNNWDNLLAYKAALNAYVYYRVLETETDYYILYALYHPQDWKLLFDHENDFETLTLMIHKDSTPYGTLALMFTQAHNGFWQYTSVDWISNGNDDIDGPIEFENGKPIVYVEAKGHGIYGNRDDMYLGGYDSIVKYVFQNNYTEHPDYDWDGQVAYSLIPIIRSLWPKALDPNYIGNGKLFDRLFTYYGSRYSLSYQIPGSLDGDNGSEDAASAPWGQGDDDESSYGAHYGDYFFDPALYVTKFLTISGEHSLTYLYNPYLFGGKVEFNAPDITILSPSPDSYIGSNYVTIQWSVSDESPIYKVYLYIDGVLEETYESTDGTYFAYISTDGSHSLRIKAVDVWGNYRVYTQTFYIDTRDPQIVSLYLDPGTVSWSNTVKVTFRAIDNLALSRFRIYANTTLVHSDVLSGSIDETKSVEIYLEDGWYTISVSVNDKANNVGSSSIDLLVDTKPPDLSIDNPTRIITSEPNVALSWHATDNLALEKIVINVNDTTVELSPSTTSYNVDLPSDGTYKVTITAVDVAGHETSQSLTIIKDTDSPSVSIIDPLDGSIFGYPGEVTISVYAEDDIGIDRLTIFANGTNYGDLYPLDTRVNWSKILSFGESGIYVIDVIAWDTAGNIGSSQIHIIIDLVSPEISVFSPINNSRYPPNVTLKWSITDGHTEVATYSILLDNEPIDEGLTGELHLVLSIGEHELRIHAVDSANNSASVVIRFYVAGLEILNPQNYTYLNTTLVRLDISGVFVDNVYILANGSLKDIVSPGSVTLSLSEGTWILIVKDTELSQVEASVIFTIDITPPQIIGEDYMVTNSSEVLLSWEISDNTGIAEIFLVVLSPTNREAIYHLEEPYLVLNLEDGTWIATLNVMDYAGNKNSFTTRITVDTTPPEIFVSQENNTVLKLNSTLSWSIEDPSGVSNAEVLLNGELISREIIGSLTFSSEGEQVLLIVAEDALGNSITMYWRFLVVEPIPVIVVGLENTTYYRSSPNVTISSLETIQNMTIYVNSTLYYQGTNTNNKTITLDLEDGYYEIVILVIDAHNYTHKYTYRIHIDSTPPTIFVNGEPTTNNSTVISNTTPIQISITITDNIALYYAQITINGTEKTNNTSNMTIEINGNTTITVSAQDKAGNTRTIRLEIIIIRTNQTQEQTPTSDTIENTTQQENNTITENTTDSVNTTNQQQNEITTSEQKPLEIPKETAIVTLAIIIMILASALRKRKTSP